MLEYLLDPVVLLFFLVAIIVAAGTVICCVSIFARNGNDEQERQDRRDLLRNWMGNMVQADEDYKALVESYLRETGKVYVRPARTVNEKLRPPEPNPYRYKPPTWATPAPKTKVEKQS